jgi:hypothetical protein
MTPDDTPCLQFHALYHGTALPSRHGTTVYVLCSCGRVLRVDQATWRQVVEMHRAAWATKLADGWGRWAVVG